MKYIMTFGSTHKVLKAESILKSKDVKFRLDPAPKFLKPLCALVITLDGDALDTAKEVLHGESLSPIGIYSKENSNYVEV